jgi:hypothetical protein
MSKLLFLIFFNCVLLSSAQNGNDWANPILVDGQVTVNELATLSLMSASNFSTDCNDDSGVDLFFKHTVNLGAESMTIGMNSSGVGVGGVVIRYQILKVNSQGGIDSGFSTICDQFTVSGFLLPSGGFSVNFENPVAGDVYILRFFKPSGFLDELLASLLESSTITMESEAPTLSITNNTLSKFKYVVNKKHIKLINNNFKNLAIYSLNGKEIVTKKLNHTEEYVEINNLNTGIYVMVLQNSKKTKVVKFIKP